MAAKPPQFNVGLLFELWNKLPFSLPVKIVIIAIVALVFIAYSSLTSKPTGSGSNAKRGSSQIEKPNPSAFPSSPSDRKPPPPAGPGEYFFCFWNVENLFDDQNDKLPKPDDRYDQYFANNPDALKLKLDNLASVLLAMNGDKGPDILALAECESPRAAELLQLTLNEKLGGKATPYDKPLVVDLSSGRHITPAVITRLPSIRDKTQMHGNRLRILETHIKADGKDLVVIASHWTSRISDKTGDSRAKYGDQIRGVFNAMARTNPEVAFLVCGDFNDDPDDPSVTKHLRAIGDRAAVLSGGQDPPLFNVFAGKPMDQWGTLYYNGRWNLFDQICVSPAMLRSPGWQCLPETAASIRTLVKPKDKTGKPWRFGDERDDGNLDRGYSDHFPVTVKLKVS